MSYDIYTVETTSGHTLTIDKMRSPAGQNAGFADYAASGIDASYNCFGHAFLGNKATNGIGEFWLDDLNSVKRLTLGVKAIYKSIDLKATPIANSVILLHTALFPVHAFIITVPRTILVDVLNKDGSVLRAAGTFSADSGVDTKNGASPFQDQSMTPKPLFNKIYRDYSEMQFTLGDPLNGVTQYVLKKAD